jgi:hypothetical protein
MWVIVAVTLGFSGEPKLSVVPGPEFQTEAACVRPACTPISIPNAAISRSRSA